jgi:hypothetical protein
MEIAGVDMSWWQWFVLIGFFVYGMNGFFTVFKEIKDEHHRTSMITLNKLKKKEDKNFEKKKV